VAAAGAVRALRPRSPPVCPARVSCGLQDPPPV